MLCHVHELDDEEFNDLLEGAAFICDSARNSFWSGLSGELLDLLVPGPVDIRCQRRVLRHPPAPGFKQFKMLSHSFVTLSHTVSHCFRMLQSVSHCFTLCFTAVRKLSPMGGAIMRFETQDSRNSHEDNIWWKDWITRRQTKEERFFLKSRTRRDQVFWTMPIAVESPSPNLREFFVFRSFTATQTILQMVPRNGCLWV